MGTETLRVVAVALFAVAAALAGVGNVQHEHWLVAVAFVCFGGGAISFLRWRASARGRVFASEVKTLPHTAESSSKAAEPESEA